MPVLLLSFHDIRGVIPDPWYQYAKTSDANVQLASNHQSPILTLTAAQSGQDVVSYWPSCVLIRTIDKHNTTEEERISLEKALHSTDIRELLLRKPHLTDQHG